MNDTLNLALKKMPKKFTSHMFSLACQELGLEKSLLQRGVICNFLKPICKRNTERGFTWEKLSTERKPYQTAVFAANDTNSQTESEQIANAIKLLKSHGYKVLMPTTGYEEV